MENSIWFKLLKIVFMSTLVSLSAIVVNFTTGSELNVLIVGICSSVWASLYEAVYAFYSWSDKELDYTFKAPTEEVELSIINNCIDMDLELGEFWYKWFASNKKGNHTLLIECNESGLSDYIRRIKEFDSIKIDKFFSVQEIKLPEFCDFQYQYRIHFKEVADEVAD